MGKAIPVPRHFVFLTLSIIFLTAACSEEATQTPREPFVAITALPTASQTPVTTFINKNWTTSASSQGKLYVGKMHVNPMHGGNWVPGEQPKALTYSNCSFTSEPLGEPLSTGLTLTSQIVGVGTGHCKNWYVLTSSAGSVQSGSDNQYVWIPDTSLTSISPESTASDLIHLPPTPASALLPLIACDPVGWWQFSWKSAWPTSLPTLGGSSKMEFQHDLSQIKGPKWPLNWYGDVWTLSGVSLEEGFWRGGYRLNNGYAIGDPRHGPAQRLQVSASRYQGIGWDDEKLRPWDEYPDDDRRSYVFLWRYISPDKVPTAEPNYAIEIRTSLKHTAYAELSFGCEHMRGDRPSDHTYFGFSADRLNHRDYPYVSPDKPNPTWPVIAHKQTMFDSHICDPVGLWIGLDWIGTVKYKYRRVFLDDGSGYEQLVEIGSRNYRPPYDTTLPFWWRMEGTTVLYKEFSATTSLIDDRSRGATARLKFSDSGCHELFSHDLYKFTGALADLKHSERRFGWERFNWVDLGLP